MTATLRRINGHWGLVDDWQGIDASGKGLRKHLPFNEVICVQRRTLDDYEIEHPQGVFTVGPYRLRPVDYDKSLMEWSCVKAGWWFYVDWPTRRIRKTGRYTKLYLIALATIWGLADDDLYSTASWTQIYAVRWLDGKFKARKHSE